MSKARGSATGAIPKSISFDKAVYDDQDQGQGGAGGGGAGGTSAGTGHKTRRDKSFLKNLKSLNFPRIGRNRGGGSAGGPGGHASGGGGGGGKPPSKSAFQDPNNSSKESSPMAAGSSSSECGPSSTGQDAQPGLFGHYSFFSV